MSCQGSPSGRTAIVLRGISKEVCDTEGDPRGRGSLGGPAGRVLASRGARVVETLGHELGELLHPRGDDSRDDAARVDLVAEAVGTDGGRRLDSASTSTRRPASRRHASPRTPFGRRPIAPPRGRPQHALASPFFLSLHPSVTFLLSLDPKPPTLRLRGRFYRTLRPVNRDSLAFAPAFPPAKRKLPPTNGWRWLPSYPSVACQPRLRPPRNYPCLYTGSTVPRRPALSFLLPRSIVPFALAPRVGANGARSGPPLSLFTPRIAIARG